MHAGAAEDSTAEGTFGRRQAPWVSVACRSRRPGPKDGTNGGTKTRALDDRAVGFEDIAAHGRAGVTGMASHTRYEIRVNGVLDGRWTAWFEGLHVTSDGSQTVICGPVADQAALHGVLNKIRDLGLVLISVHRLDPD